VTRLRRDDNKAENGGCGSERESEACVNDISIKSQGERDRAARLIHHGKRRVGKAEETGGREGKGENSCM